MYHCDITVEVSCNAHYQYTHWLFNWYNDIALHETTGCIAEQSHATFEQTGLPVVPESIRIRHRARVRDKQGVNFLSGDLGFLAWLVMQYQ